MTTWVSLAIQKVWEGFFYGLGSGIALALAVKVIVTRMKKVKRLLKKGKEVLYAIT